MASGHVSRTHRPNTWVPPTKSAIVKNALANPEPSTHGPSVTYPSDPLMSAFGVNTGRDVLTWSSSHFDPQESWTTPGGKSPS
jgi:hypothetical protein